MQSLIEESTKFKKLGVELLRYKGILAIANDDRKLIFQGVQRVVGFDYGDLWEPLEERRSRIVLIGKNLPEKPLREAFLNCLQASLW